MVPSPASFRTKVRAPVAVRVYTKEAKHTNSERGGDSDQRSRTDPDDGICPPREKEVSRVFGMGVVIRVNLLPIVEDWVLPKGTVKDEPMEGIKKEGANSVPSHE